MVSNLELPVEIDKRTSDPIWFFLRVDNSLVLARTQNAKNWSDSKSGEYDWTVKEAMHWFELITHKIDSPQDPTAILTHDLVRKSKDKYLKAWRKLNAIGNDK